LYSSDYNEYYLLKCDTIQSGRSSLLFFSNILPPSSRLKKKYVASTKQAALLGFLFSPENGSNMFV
jgi:hypothetical protein